MLRLLINRAHNEEYWMTQYEPWWLGDYEIWIEALSQCGRNYVVHACSHADCVRSVAVSESTSIDTAIARRSRATDRAIDAADLARYRRKRAV